MATATQRKASSAHRTRVKSRGLARLEVQVPAGDVVLCRQVATVLRGPRGPALRRALEAALQTGPPRTGLDLLRSSLPDEDASEALNQVLNEPRSTEIREIDW